MTPSEMKLRKDSVKIADGICSAAEMMMTLMQFGRMCLRMIRLLFAPDTCAARTYSFCLIVRIWPRTSLAIPTQYRSPNTMNSEIMLVPSLARIP